MPSARSSWCKTVPFASTLFWDSATKGSTVITEKLDILTDADKPEVKVNNTTDATTSVPYLTIIAIAAGGVVVVAAVVVIIIVVSKKKKKAQ